MVKKLILMLTLATTCMASTYKVDQVPAPLANLGEGPHWDWETQNLYYVDIYGNKEGTINRYNPKENKTYTATVGELSFNYHFLQV
ncbi:hypothetical protein DMENIID0001_093000 [Sergentomyia squamirostris]